MKRILIVLDASPATARATTCAIRLARSAGAQLAGLAVADVQARLAPLASMGIGSSAYAKEAREAAVSEERAQARSSIADFMKACAAEGITPETLDVEGDTALVVGEEALGHDLALIGAGAVPGEEDSFAVALDVLKVGAGPVLVVAPDRSDVTPAKVLAGIDGHPPSWRSLAQFVSRFEGAQVQEVLLFNAYQNDKARTNSGAMLAKAAAFVRSHGFHVRTVARLGVPESLLLEAAREEGVDTLVLGLCSRPFSERFSIGSLVHGALRSNAYSLFLYH